MYSCEQNMCWMICFIFFVWPRPIGLHGDQIENKIANLYNSATYMLVIKYCGGHKFVTFSTAHTRVVSGGRVVSRGRVVGERAPP